MKLHSTNLNFNSTPVADLVTSFAETLQVLGVPLAKIQVIELT